MKFTKHNNPNKKRKTKKLSYDEKIVRAANNMEFLQNQGLTENQALDILTNKYNLPK